MRALAAPGSDRVGVRLAIAQVMASQDHPNDARRQIALALMEAHTGETLPPTGEQLMEAADVFLSLHDYQLAQMYLQRAQAAGAPETEVRIGLANTYLAVGDTARARRRFLRSTNRTKAIPLTSICSPKPVFIASNITTPKP